MSVFVWLGHYSSRVPSCLLVPKLALASSQYVVNDQRSWLTITNNLFLFPASLTTVNTSVWARVMFFSVSGRHLSTSMQQLGGMPLPSLKYWVSPQSVKFFSPQHWSCQQTREHSHNECERLFSSTFFHSVASRIYIYTHTISYPFPFFLHTLHFLLMEGLKTHPNLCKMTDLICSQWSQPSFTSVVRVFISLEMSSAARHSVSWLSDVSQTLCIDLLGKQLQCKEHTSPELQPRNMFTVLQPWNKSSCTVRHTRSEKWFSASFQWRSC